MRVANPFESAGQISYESKGSIRESFMKKIRILIVDDHLLIRAGLRSLLDGMAGIEVVGEAGDGQRALEVVKSKTPDVVLMDISMEGMNGLEATSRVTREFPNIGVVI